MVDIKLEDKVERENKARKEEKRNMMFGAGLAVAGYFIFNDDNLMQNMATFASGMLFGSGLISYLKNMGGYSE